jgi:hypothetical protein
MGLIHFAGFCLECSPTQHQVDRRGLEPALLKLRFALATTHRLEIWYSNLLSRRSPEAVLWENELGDISENTSIGQHVNSRGAYGDYERQSAYK